MIHILKLEEDLLKTTKKRHWPADIGNDWPFLKKNYELFKVFTSLVGVKGSFGAK